MSELPIHPLQALLDGMSAAAQRKRAGEQMTLGGMIAALEALPSGAKVTGLGDEMSYRGYYSDLAFEPSDTPRPAAELLAQCRAAMGRVYQGYKGGDFVMGALTPLWVADYGECGSPIIGLQGAAGELVPVLGVDD